MPNIKCNNVQIVPASAHDVVLAANHKNKRCTDKTASMAPCASARKDDVDHQKHRTYGRLDCVSIGLLGHIKIIKVLLRVANSRLLLGELYI